MKKLLVIESSPRGPHSSSRTISTRIVDQIKKAHPSIEVLHRDLIEIPLPHLAPETVEAFFTPPDQRSSDQNKITELSDKVTQELISADAVLISSPMWNFSVPSNLKAWIDHVVRAGLTFRYGDQGPEGLLSPTKKVFLALSSGGVYSSGPQQSLDHLSSYLTHIFQFLGVQDIQTVRAEGTAYPDNEGKAVEAALASTSKLKL